MNRYEPQSIRVIDADVYELVALIKGELCTHNFTFKANPISARNLHREPYYYSRIWDIPETEWLEKAIYYFDEARSASLATRVAEPVSILVKDHSNYEVKKADGSAETITVNEINDLRTATGPHGTCDAHLEPPGFWKTAPEADSMLAAILMLHQAIHPKYKIATADH